MSQAKKCIVLDLDNTLWGGVVGEDGFDGIALSTKPPGAYYLAFQQALRDMRDRGIILAINSKNNASDALRVIRDHPHMILKENDFAAIRINWENKAENIRSIAKELNIGLDSMVFLDDTPQIRQEMRLLVPEVETPEMPESPAQYAKFLHTLSYFEMTAITDEDKMRGNFYVTERLRKEAQKQYIDRSAYLESLHIELKFFENDPRALARLSQLTEKTNQFNTKKKPLSEEELIRYIDSKEYGVYYGQAIDMYGDQGIIAFALVRKGKTLWRIESLLLSCRVIGRGIEDAFVAEIAARAREAGAKKIGIQFEKTKKNAPAEEFVIKSFGKEHLVDTEKIHRPSWVQIS